MTFKELSNNTQVGKKLDLVSKMIFHSNVKNEITMNALTGKAFTFKNK
jgi:hypothetical protein